MACHCQCQLPSGSLNLPAASSGAATPVPMGSQVLVPNVLGTVGCPQTFFLLWEQRGSCSQGHLGVGHLGVPSPMSLGWLPGTFTLRVPDSSTHHVGFPSCQHHP
uniref:Uncharacterized protein n=1 Tax=Cyanoderma ruficeps TaxID=181631 RepID=A0A8C3QHY6_9PASS